MRSFFMVKLLIVRLVTVRLLIVRSESRFILRGSQHCTNKHQSRGKNNPGQSRLSSPLVRQRLSHGSFFHADYSCNVPGQHVRAKQRASKNWYEDSGLAFPSVRSSLHIRRSLAQQCYGPSSSMIDNNHRKHEAQRNVLSR